MPPTVRSLWQSFWKLHLFARTLIWVALLWLLFVPFILTHPDKKHPEETSSVVWGMLTFYAFWGIIIYLIRAGITKSIKGSADARALMAYKEPAPHLHRSLSSIYNFSVAQWCILPTPTGARGLAVNTDHTSIVILDYFPPTTLQDTPIINSRVVNAIDVIRAELDEDAYQQTQVSTVTQTKGKSHAGTGSLLGRAIVGGVLLGPTGAVIGGATAKRYSTSTGVTTGTHTAHTKVRRLELKLTINNPIAPLERLPFLLGEVDKTDGNYGAARSNADHWLAMFDIMAHRRASGQNGNMAQTPGYFPHPDPNQNGRLF